MEHKSFPNLGEQNGLKKLHKKIIRNKNFKKKLLPALHKKYIKLTKRGWFNMNLKLKRAMHNKLNKT